MRIHRSFWLSIICYFKKHRCHLYKGILVAEHVDAEAMKINFFICQRCGAQGFNFPELEKNIRFEVRP